MSPQRRTALVSIVAASVLIAVKLSTGVASGSLGLVSEAVHSGTDLVAALLTFFAVGYAGRPADEGHPYGHGKAEHLAALAEAGILSLVSIGVAALAVARLAGWVSSEVEPRSGLRGSTRAQRCSRTRSTSAAISPARWRSSPASSPPASAGLQGTPSPRSSSPPSYSPLRRD